MRRSISWISVCLVLGLLFIASASLPAQEQEQRIPLLIGIQDGTLKVSGMSLEMTYGDALILTITNLSKKTVRVSGYTGVVLYPVDSRLTRLGIRALTGRTLSEQKAALVDAIILKPRQTQKYTFQVYSLDFKRKDPVKRAPYVVSEHDQILMALFIQADEMEASDKMIQAAVWMRPGGVSNRMMTDRMKIERIEVLEARDLLNAAIQNPVE